MKRFSLRLWSFLLAMLMVLSLVPMAVMASEEQNDDVIVLTTEGGGTITIIRSNTQTEEKEDVLTVAEPKEYQAGEATTVATEAELKNALAAGGEIKLTADITTTAALNTEGVTATIDLNSYTLNVRAGDNKFIDESNITIKNGTINIDGVVVGGNAVFCLDEYEKTLVTKLTLVDVDLVGENYSSAYGIFYIGDSSVLTVEGGEWKLTNDLFEAGGVFKADTAKATLNITGTTMDLHNVRRGVTWAATTIDGATIKITGDADGVDAEMEHGFNRSPLTITNSTITMENLVGRGITAEGGAVVIEGTSSVTMTNCQEATLDVRAGQTVTIEETATVEMDAAPTINNGTIAGDGKVEIIVTGLSGAGKATDPFLINNIKELEWFRDDVNAGNNYSGKYVKLTDNIDLSTVANWMPIGNSTNKFQGTFDGNDKTISNLVIEAEGKSNIGFFGFTTNGEIKNLTINNAKVTGRLNVGVVAGTPYTSKYTDIKVTGHVEVNGMAYVGGVGGKNAYANWTNITVDVDNTSYVKGTSTENGVAYRTYVGGIVGFNGEGSHTFKNISSNIKVIGDVSDIGGLFGIAHYGNNFDTVTFAGTVEAPEGADEVGGIAGVWHNQAGYTVTMNNVTVADTAKVTINGEDVTATNGVVGSAYNASNETVSNSGSLKIEGEEAWLKPAAKIGETEYATLQAALDAAYAAGGTVTVTLLADVAENVTLTEKVGMYCTIDGAGKTVKGKITIAPLSDTNDNRRITIQNVNFVNTADTAVDFITANVTNHYPRLSVLDCSFTGNGKETDVAIRTKSAYDLIIKDCTGTGLHSFLQNRAGVKVTVRNVTVTESKGGLALSTAQNVTVRGCNLTTDTYGIRLDAELDTSVTLHGNVVNAYVPVSVRNATATDYKLSFNGSDSSYTATNADGVWCAICTTEYEEGKSLNEATGNVKITWNTDVLDKSSVYGAYEWPIEVVYGDGYTKGFDSLMSAMNSGYSGSTEKTIIVHKDITESMDELSGNIATDNPNGVTIKNTIVDSWIYCSEDFTIGEGVTYDATGYASGLFVYAEDAVINGTVLTDCYYQRYAGTKLTINEPGSMTVKTETFILRYTDGDAEAGIYVVGDNDDSTVGLNASVIYFYQGIISAKNADIKVGTYWQTNETDGTGSANLVLDNSNMTVTVNEHNMKATGNSTVTLTNGSSVSVAGGYQGAAVEMDETSSMTKNGASVLVAKVGDVGYAASLQAAVNAAAEGDTIVLLADVEQADGVIITDKKLTIDLNGKTFTVSKGDSTNNRNFKINGASVVTIKNGTMVAKGDYSSGAYGTVRTEGTANVTLTDLKLYNYRGNGLNIKALSGTTVTMNDVEIYAQYGGGVEAAGGTVELTDVTIVQKGMYTAPYNSMAISVNGGGKAIVYSGTYSTECLTAEEANNQGTSHGPWVAGVLNSGGTLTIKGGTFSNDNFGENNLATYARGLFLADTGAVIEVEGGTFNALKTVFEFQNNLGDASKQPGALVSGGTFSADPTDGNYPSFIELAEGFEVVENADGTYGVEEMIAVAQIGEKKYYSLQAALDAAVVAGDTVEVVLLEDIDLTGTTWTPVYFDSYSASGANTLIINGNHKTITGLSDMLFSGIWTGTKFEVKDLTIDKANIKHDVDDAAGTVGVGAIVGNVSAIETVVLSNVKLTDSYVEGGHWTGGFFGFIAGYSKENDGPVFTTVEITNCAVIESVIVGKGSVGGVVGHATGDAWTSFGIAESTVTGNTITSTGTSNNKAGIVAGTIGAAGTELNGKTGGVSVSVTESENTATSHGTEITTVYGRQGSTTGKLTVTGGKYENKPVEDNVSYAAPAEGFEIVENADGSYGIQKEKVAEVNGTKYETLAEAAAAAQAGQTIILLADVTEDVTLPAGVIFNGNGKSVGVITAEGTITFEGHTKATNFGVAYTNTEINIGVGACLEITGTGRLVIGHGCTFNIEGNITDAKTADKSTIQPSLIMPGASFTGAGVTFNVKNAYIKTTASYCSSSKSASGTFDFNIENSIWEQFDKLAFESQSVNATVDFELKDSVLTTGSHLVFGVSRGEVVIDNSNVNVGTARQIENQSTMTIKNGAVVNGAVATSSNAKNPGTIIVEDATYAVTGEFSGSDLGTGTLIIKKGATVSAGSITKANIKVDATGMAAGDTINLTANLANHAGTLSVVNNDKLEAKIVDGKIVLAVKPVAQIGETTYATLEDAFKAATSGCTIEILSDVTVDYYWDVRYTGAKFTVPVTIDGNDHTLTFTNTVYDGGNYFSAFRFEDDATVKNLTIDMKNAQSGFQGRFRAISAKANLTVDGCTFIGNGSTANTRAIIFGESAGANVGNLEISITNSEFQGWRRAISDNENAQDVKTVEITGNTVTDASIYVSATDTVTLTGNTVEDGYVNIKSYTANNTLDVTATGNTLEANGDPSTTNCNKINAGGTIIAQDGFVVPATGDIQVGYVTDNFNHKGYSAISGEAVKVNAKESFVVKMYKGTTLVGTATLNDPEHVLLNGVSKSISWHAALTNDGDTWWVTEWVGGALKADSVPDRVELWVDGEMTSEGEVKLNNADNSYPVVAAKVDENGVIEKFITAAPYIGNADYAAAMNTAFAEGGNLVMLRDLQLAAALVVANGTSVTLDLNGKTIAGTDNATGSFGLITNRGTLTIKDSAGNGKITLVATNNREFYNYSSVLSNTVGGKLIVESGTFEHLGGTDMAYGIDNLTNGKGTYAETVINGGTVKSTYRAIRQFLNGVEAQNILTINDGTIEGTNKSVWMQDPSKNANTGALTIGENATIKGDVYLTVTEDSTEWPVEVSVAAAALDGASKVLTNQHVPAGYELQLNNGSYGVIKCVASITDAEGNVKNYASLADAFAAVQEGETIELLAGTISEGTIKMPAALKNVTIKGAADHTSILKDMKIMSCDGNSIAYEGLTFDGIVFDNSNIVITGWRSNGVTLADLTITNCIFKDIVGANTEAAVHLNLAATEAVNGFTFTNNVIDGVSGGDKSGVYFQATGEVIFTGNKINNVAFRPFVLQTTSDDGVADTVVIEGNTFSGSAAGRLQLLTNNASGTDATKITTTNNVITGITSAQQICYWKLPANTEVDISKNYYDVDIVANPGLIYLNSAATSVRDLADMGVFPIYTELNDDGTIDVTSEFTPVIIPFDGEGTATAPYQITSVEDLKALAELVNGGMSFEGTYFVVTAAIDLASEANWTPIGKSGAPFSGIFDGGNYTISNLKASGESHVGLFGLMSGGTAVIKNVKINNATVSGISYVAALVGQGYTGTIDNCHVSGSIQISGNYMVGGISGQGYAALKNCSVIGDGAATSFIKGVYSAVDLEGDKVGGIVGHCAEGTKIAIDACTVSGVTITGTRSVGGIVGTGFTNHTITDCTVTDVVIGTNASTEYAADNAGKLSVGGIVGEYRNNDTNGQLNNCVVKNVTFTNENSVTASIGALTGGWRNGTMTDPVNNVTPSNNEVWTTTITGTNNEYLMVAVADVDGATYYTLYEAVAAANGKTVKLLSDVTVRESVEIAENDVITLDLNGKTINAAYVSGSTTNHVYAFTVNVNGEMTITGNGVINTRGIYNYGKLTLENGTINAIDGNGGYGVVSYAGATFTMNGGTIATTLEDDNKVDEGGYDATTVRVEAGATFTMKGGEIKNICDFTVAIDNHGTTTIEAGKVSSVHTTVANYGTLTIEGGEFTCDGLEGITAHAVWAADGTTTIKGGTFDGKDNYNGFNVDASEGAVVNITGGTFLAVHSGSLYGEGTITVSGGIFFDEVPAERCAEGYVPAKNADDTYGVKVGASVYGSTVNLGSALGMKFFVEKNVLLAVMAANGDETLEGYYAVITRTYADGTTDTQTVTNWIEYDYSGKETMPLYVFGYGNINAKEMIDMISFQVFDAEGNAITEVYTDSIQAFTMRSVAHEEAKASPSASLLKLLVDMLNYGAAAQTYETYAVDNLANSKLTEAQKAYGTASETAVPDDNDQILSVTGATEYYYGDTLNLGTDIRMKIFFQNLTPEQLASISAKVTFTNHEGEAYELTYAASDFAKYGDTDYYVIGIDKLVAADANTVVTCVVMIDGETTLTIENSINDYLYRAYSYDTENQSIYHAVYYYCDSANAYFHPTTTAAE